MPDDHDTTMWERVRPRRRTYEGEDRRGPEPVNWLAWLPLALAVLAGVTGYVRMQAGVETLQRDMMRMEAAHAKDMTRYQGWNKSISERVRELERGR